MLDTVVLQLLRAVFQLRGPVVLLGAGKLDGEKSLGTCLAENSKKPLTSPFESSSPSRAAKYSSKYSSVIASKMVRDSVAIVRRDDGPGVLQHPTHLTYDRADLPACFRGAHALETMDNRAALHAGWRSCRSWCAGRTTVQEGQAPQLAPPEGA